MKITLHCRQNKNISEIEDYTQRSLSFALGRFSERLSCVEMRLQDINGPRGGLDQECSVILKLRDGKVLKTKVLKEDWHKAIDHVADRISHTLSRYLKAQRASRFQSGMTPREGGFAS